MKFDAKEAYVPPCMTLYVCEAERMLALSGKTEEIQTEDYIYNW